MKNKKQICAMIIVYALLGASLIYAIKQTKTQNKTSSSASAASTVSLKKNITVKTGQNGYLATKTSQTSEETTENPLENLISDDNLCELDWRDTDSFYYQSLSDSEKVMYRQILTSITTRKYAKLMTQDETVIDTVFNYVLANHPELYYVSGYEDGIYQSTVAAADDETEGSIDGERDGKGDVNVDGEANKKGDGEGEVFALFLSNYTYTQDDCKKGDAFIADYVKDCVDTVDTSLSDKNKAKVVYDYIITKTAYVIDPEDDQTILSIAANKKAVCAGYAKMFQYIMQNLHIDCYPVYGKVGDIDHMWDIVKIDGEWVHVDCTLGEPDELQWDGAESSDNDILYDCFCVSTNEILKSHSIDDQSILPN